MGIFDKLKNVFKDKPDIVDAYGDVLENHPGPIEPIELLPFSKAEIKEALLLEAFRPESLHDKNRLEALCVGFLGLAVFQPGILKDGLLKINQLLNPLYTGSRDANNLSKEIYSVGKDFDLFIKLMHQVNIERQQLALEWQHELDRFSQALQQHMKLKGQ